MPIESSPDGIGESETPGRATVRRRIRGQAEAIRREELGRALSRLEAAGEASAADHEALKELADRLTAAILSGPESVLEQDDVDEEALVAAMNLFGEDD